MSAEKTIGFRKKTKRKKEKKKVSLLKKGK